MKAELLGTLLRAVITGPLALQEAVRGQVDLALSVTSLTLMAVALLPVSFVMQLVTEQDSRIQQ